MCDCKADVIAPLNTHKKSSVCVCVQATCSFHWMAMQVNTLAGCQKTKRHSTKSERGEQQQQRDREPINNENIISHLNFAVNNSKIFGILWEKIQVYTRTRNEWLVYEAARLCTSDPFHWELNVSMNGRRRKMKELGHTMDIYIGEFLFLGTSWQATLRKGVPFVRFVAVPHASVGKTGTKNEYDISDKLFFSKIYIFSNAFE